MTYYFVTLCSSVFPSREKLGKEFLKGRWAYSQRGINGIILTNKTVQFDRLALIKSRFALQAVNPLFP